MGERLGWLDAGIYKCLRTATVDQVSIRVDDFSTLTSALDRNGIHLRADPRATGHSYAGVRVIADPRMPAGFAAIVVNGDVVQILDLRPAPVAKEKE